ncbi:sugar ABC transporter substrate-binding protein [Aeromicrobium endophyticum]|uniref:Sugar ABC transporter substrate-binding protein n=1 Tax=Aeromicrobium endophyticum TaxID=2292704 RepID=A0A371NYV8_9ACTN|nr:sugar ABC transporter substrate-binding protein [Aeromicrobium endophyticum]REK68877.1 sugar ABC transporter substrate-binding protein [Aeromicrobium endophyticum]
MDCITYHSARERAARASLVRFSPAVAAISDQMTEVRQIAIYRWSIGLASVPTRSGRVSAEAAHHFPSIGENMISLKNPRRLVSLTAVASAVALGLGACGSDSSGSSADCAKEYTIGFSHPVGEAAFVKALKLNIEKKAKENGCVDVLMDNTQANDLGSQRSTIETWVTQGVDAIVVFPVDASSIATLQKSAQEKGIKWLTYASPAKGADGYTGFDNVQSGKLIGEAAASFIETNQVAGKVTAAVTTLEALPDVKGRWEEPIKAITDAGVKVVSKQDCADQACGLEKTESLLRQYPDLRIFVGLNDDAALGAAKAFKNAGIDPAEVFIGGQDGALEALEAVKAGGSYKISAAIDMIDLAGDIVDNSVNAVDGEGETETQAAVVPATLDDPAKLDALIAQLQVK